MKRVAPLLAIAAVAVAVFFFIQGHRATADFRKGVSAESKGDHREAQERFAAAADRFFPGMIVPDVNRSKVLSSIAWKKEMAEYVSWLSGSGAEKVDRKQKNALLGAIARNAPFLPAENFFSNTSVHEVSVGRYAEIWNGAFFARGVSVDSAHQPLAAAAFGKPLSIIMVSALSSYTYSVAMLDTSIDRRTTFTVNPESATFVLAAPGAHILLCQSSYKPAPGQMWRSSPTVIPCTVPPTPSLMKFTIETHVKRKKRGGE